MLQINLGCSAKLIPGWTNIDIQDMLVWARTYAIQRVKEFEKEFICADARSFLLAVPDASIENIAMIHFLDHLTPTDSIQLLTHCHRILKPEGTLRIEVEDLAKIIQAWQEGRMQEWAKDQPEEFASAHPDLQLAYMIFGNLSGSTEYSGHKMSFTHSSLAELLSLAGFRTSIAMNYGESNIKNWESKYDTQPDHSLFMEAIR